MKYLILVLAIFLAACGTVPQKPEPQVVVKKEYVVRTADASLKAIPPLGPKIDPDKASQADLARWIKDTEEHRLKLEARITTLIEFYEKPVKEEDKK